MNLFLGFYARLVDFRRYCRRKNEANWRKRRNPNWRGWEIEVKGSEGMRKVWERSWEERKALPMDSKRRPPLMSAAHRSPEKKEDGKRRTRTVREWGDVTLARFKERNVRLRMCGSEKVREKRWAQWCWWSVGWVAANIYNEEEDGFMKKRGTLGLGPSKLT